MKKVWIVQILAIISVIVSLYDIRGIVAALSFLFVNLIQIFGMQRNKSGKYFDNVKQEANNYYDSKKKEADNYCITQKNLMKQQKEEYTKYYDIKLQEVDRYCIAKKEEADNYCITQKNLIEQQKEEHKKYYDIKLQEVEEYCAKKEEEIKRQKEKNERYYSIKLQEIERYSTEREEKIDEYCTVMKEATEEYCAKREEEVEEYCNKRKNSVKELKIHIKNLKLELDMLEKNMFIKYADIYIDDKTSSEEYKNELSIMQLKEKDLIKSNKALVITSSDSKKVLNNNIKQILRCFNAETAIILNSVTAKNMDISRGKIQRSFEILNRIFETDGVALSYDFLDIKFEQLRLIYSYIIKSEEEKETQRAIREKLIEEQKVLKEIEKEKTKLEKEEKQFRNEISKLMAYMQKSSDIEKQLYIDKIRELEERLKELEKDKTNVLQREQNTRAGFVYVISNIGSFGENIYKIGMTRRLEPMDRIKELSNASVPFEFDVHAMIFSEDAPKLEKILHQTFDKNRVNKLNLRKEFFNIDIAEIEKVVKENHNTTVNFKLFAEAEQYRQSINICE